MTKFQLGGRASLFALIAATAAAPQVSFAQQQAAQAETDVVEEVVVTSTRAGLERAIQVKRASDQIVDSVVAADIGKLPDVNVAESLQRVSGVQIKRSLGEGTQVSIRGLTQNITLVNGREVVDASGRGGSGIDTLGTGSYGLLAQLPAEIIQRLDVTKLAAASDVEGALSGTVNIITARPLDTRSDTRAFSVESLYNDRSRRGGARASVVATHHFTDDLAAMINLSWSKRNIRDESVFSFTGYIPLSTAFDTGATANKLGAGGATLSRDPNGDGTPGFYLADIRDTEINDSRERFGVNSTVQWRPAEHLELTADLLYSKQSIDRTRYWYAANLSTVGTDYTQMTFSPTETVIAGTLNTQVQTNSELYTNTGETLATGLSGKFEYGDLTLRGDVNYSRSKQNQYQTFLRLTSKAKHLVNFEFREVDAPGFKVATSLNLLDPTQYNFTNYFDNADTADSDLKAARLDAEYRLSAGPLSKLKAGVRFSELSVDQAKYQSQLGGAVSADTVPDSYFIRTLDILGGASGYTTQTLLFPQLFGGGKTLACQVRGTTCAPRIRSPLASYVTNEKTDAAYAQADIDTEIAGAVIKGNVGVRYVKTDFKADGARTSASSSASVLPVAVKKSYDDILPSLSLRAELADKLILRAGAAKVLARPNSADQNPGLNLATAAPFVATAGNAELDPFRATQYDLAAEYYFRPASLVSVGLFRKDLKSFIVRSGSTEVYDGVTYIVTRPRNGTDAKIEGVEVSYQDNLDFLPAPFDGLGMVANYSYIESKTKDINKRTGQALPVTGLSKHNVNLIGYWEKGDYGLRVAYNWRDKFLDSIGSGGDGVFFDSNQDLSVSARWQMTEDFSVDAQISNVLDSGVRKYGGVEDATALYGLNGRTFSLALRGKF